MNAKDTFAQFLRSQKPEVVQMSAEDWCDLTCGMDQLSQFCGNELMSADEVAEWYGYTRDVNGRLWNPMAVNSFYGAQVCVYRDEFEALLQHDELGKQGITLTRYPPLPVSGTPCTHNHDPCNTCDNGIAASPQEVGDN